MWWRSWLRDCATSCKVSGSIPDGTFFDIILLTLAVGSTQPLTENEYQEYFLGRKGGPFVGLTILSLLRADCPEFWKPQLPGTQWACNRPGQGLLLLPYVSGPG
jgi:hypothetical protein